MVANLLPPYTLEEVCALITRENFSFHGLCELAFRLPGDDIIHRWLTDASSARDAFFFEYLISAAALDHRKLDATLLVHGTMFMRDPDRFAWIAWHMEGDVTACL